MPYDCLPSPRPWRSVFLSDVHLGSAGCRAAHLLRFLDGIDTERLYLVGDIIDAESLSERFFWPRLHNEVMNRLFRLAQAGMRVVYIPGNHDACARAHVGLRIGRIEIHRHAVHLAGNGRRYLVMHGDEFDHHLDRRSWQNQLGAVVYRQLVRVNSSVNDWRDRNGRVYLPLASAIKQRSSRARRYIEQYRAACLASAAARGLDGAITGHIHRPEIHGSAGQLYMNCGDWVEHCTAIGEDEDGRFELISPAVGIKRDPQRAAA
jgi:UDP-2,3-diacylglucosamine pyrophosphatase LpxH